MKTAYERKRSFKARRYDCKYHACTAIISASQVMRARNNLKTNRMAKKKENGKKERKGKSMKRILCLCMATVFCFFASSAFAEVTLPLTQEPVTMTMLSCNWASYSITESEAFKRLCDETNVYWEVTEVPSTDWNEKLNLAFVSGNLPDVIIGSMSTSQIYKYNSTGALIDMKPLIEQYAPNIRAKMEGSPEFAQVITLPNGQIASLASTSMADCTSTDECPNDFLYINQVWLDQLGLAVPTNVDELYNALIAFRDNDMNGNGDPSDEIPFTARLGVDTLRQASVMFGTVLGTTTDYNLFLNHGQVVYVPLTDEYKNYVSFLHKLYDENLMDREYFTLSAQQIAAKAENEDLLYGCFFAAGNNLVGQDRAEQYVPVMPFETNGEYYSTGRAYAVPGMFSITSACQNPELAIQWADLFYDQEYGKITWMGTDGVSYQYNDDGTWDWLYPDGCETVMDVRGHHTLLFSCGWNWVCPDDWFMINDISEAPMNKHRAMIAENYPGACRVALPTLYYSENDLKEMAILSADLNAYESEMFAKFVVGEADIETQWDEFTKTLNTIGAQKLVSIVQNAYNNR